MAITCDRRSFLQAMAALSAAGVVPLGRASAGAGAATGPRPKKPATVRGAFFYPPAQVVQEGRCEDSWAQHQWSTWPGNQFAPEEQQAKFLGKVQEMARGLDLALDLDPEPIYTDAGIAAFLAEVGGTRPDALLLFNFWNSFSAKLYPILDAYDGPIILYHPLGANHQLPPERFRTQKRLQYIHSIEHWDALQRGLRSVHAMARMRQSRLLRVSGRLEQETEERDPLFDLPIRAVPAAEFNDLFDATEPDDAARQLAAEFHRTARQVLDLGEQAFLDAVRAHATVQGLLDRHQADAITIECLFLKHRKPCLSFSILNSACVPCGCENDLNATLTLMLGTNLFGRGGFQHNPEFDLEENRYFGAHCTSLTRLRGPDDADAPYALRPFFHQLPKTLALDVEWPAGERVTLCKYHAAEKRIDAYTGQVESSPPCPPTGGCATRVLVQIDRVDDVCTIYPGPHPVLYCGDHARQVKTFAKLYDLDLRTNA